jgi:hypothetical protein
VEIGSTLRAKLPPEEVLMAEYNLISADSHIVEPPDMYTSRFDPKLRDRAPGC